MIGAERRHDLVDALADQRDFVASEHLGGAGVDQRDGAERIEADDAGRHALHHRLGELPALLVDLAGRRPAPRAAS